MATEHFILNVWETILCEVGIRNIGIMRYRYTIQYVNQILNIDKIGFLFLQNYLIVFFFSDLCCKRESFRYNIQLGYVDLGGKIWNMGRESLKYDMSMMILCLIIRQEHYMIWLDNWIIIWIFYAFLGILPSLYHLWSKYILINWLLFLDITIKQINTNVACHVI